MTLSPRYADTLQLLDGDMVVFDLNLPTGATNPSSLKTAVGSIDIGTPVPDREFFDDRLLVREDFGPVGMSLVLHTEAADYELLQAGVGTLARLLKDPKHRIKWLRETASAGEERFIHFHSADVQVLGSEEAVLRRGKAINLQISIIREPFLRGPEATLLSAVAVPNDPASANGLRSGTFTVLGDAPAEGKLVVAEASANLKHLHVGYGHEPFSDDILFLQAEAGTLATDASSVADVGASGGNVARTTFSTDQTLATRITFTNALTAGQLTAIQGKVMRVGLLIRGLPALAEHQLRLDHGFGDFSNVHPRVHVVGSDQPGDFFVWLGLIEVPDKPLNRFDLRLFASRIVGSGNLDSDFFLLMPADRLGSFTVPTALAAADRLVVDDGQAFVTNSSDALKWRAEVSGSLPVELRPGVGELVLLGLDDAGYVKGRSHTLTLTYAPRYLT